MRLRFAFLTFLLFATAGITLAECDPTTLETAISSECTASQLENLLHDPALAKLTAKAAVDKTGNEVATANKATTPPDGFAARIHNSYQDFLAPLAFAINKVEESKDGQALTIRFNPLRGAGFDIGVTGTAAKPVVLDKVQQAVDEGHRADTVKALEKKLGDFDDVTIALSATWATRECTVETVRRCIGRNPVTYRNMLSDVLLAVAPLKVKSTGQPKSKELRNFMAAHTKNKVAGGAFNAKLSDIENGDDQQKAYDLAKAAANADAADSAAYLNAFTTLDALATLIDNQPQPVLTASYRDLGQFGGPDEIGANFEYQMGLQNLGTVKGCRDDKGVAKSYEQCVADALGDGTLDATKTDKLVFSVSYKRSDHYKLSSLGSDFTDITFAGVNVPRTSEYKGKFQWGKKLAVAMKEERPRLDVSAEFNRQSESGSRKLNRFVGTATLTVPYGKNMSIPVSLSYANKPDFLKDERKKLSMHFGLSYRFPWEKKPE